MIAMGTEKYTAVYKAFAQLDGTGDGRDLLIARALVLLGIDEKIAHDHGQALLGVYSVNEGVRLFFASKERGMKNEL